MFWYPFLVLCYCWLGKFHSHVPFATCFVHFLVRYLKIKWFDTTLLFVVVTFLPSNHQYFYDHAVAYNVCKSNFLIPFNRRAYKKKWNKLLRVSMKLLFRSGSHRLIECHLREKIRPINYHHIYICEISLIYMLQ